MTLICTVQYLRYDEMRKGTIGMTYEIFEEKMGMDKHVVVVEFQDGFATWDVTALYGYLYVVGEDESDFESKVGNTQNAKAAEVDRYVASVVDAQRELQGASVKK